MTRLAKLFATTSILVLGASSAFAMQDTVHNTRAGGSSVLAAATMARNDARFVDGYRVQPYSAQEKLLADRLSGGININ